MKTTTTYTPKHPAEASPGWPSREKLTTHPDGLSRHRLAPAAFRRFRELYRGREELAGLPAATVLALRGARESRCAGYLTVRTDLPPETYLEVPFVRRSWRLLRLLAERNGETVGELPCLCPRKRDDPITWDIRRSIGMDPATARINLKILIRILMACGFLDCSVPGWISDVTAKLVRHGSPGEYYRSLLFRMCSRSSWVYEDGFPPVPAIPAHALLLLWVLQRSPAGCSAFDLAGVLKEAERLCAVEDGVGAVSTAAVRTGATNPLAGAPANPMSRNVLAAVLQARFLGRTGIMLGLTEPFEPDGVSGDTSLYRKYRTTPLARHILCWQM